MEQAQRWYCMLYLLGKCFQEEAHMHSQNVPILCCTDAADVIFLELGGRSYADICCYLSVCMSWDCPLPVLRPVLQEGFDMFADDLGEATDVADDEDQ